MRRLATAGCVLLLVSLAACGDPSLEPVKTEFDDVAVAPRCAEADTGVNCLELKANTLRLDDEAKLRLARADFDEATGVLQLELAAGASLPERLKVGAILFRGRKDRRPLLHRVEELQQDGQRVRLRLARVTAKDAFERGRLRFRVPLGATGPASTGQPLEGASTRDDIAIARQPLDVSIGPRDCSGNVFDTAVVDPRAQGQVRLDLTECRFVLTAWVDVVLRWDSAVNLDKLEVSVGGSVDAAMQAQLLADLNAQFGASKRIWEGPEIPVTVGGVLFTLNPSVYAGYDLSAQASLTVAQGFSYTGSITEGFGWSDRKKWYTIDERTSAFTNSGPTVSFDGNVTATLWVKPRLDVKALGLVGGNIALKTFAKGRITSTATSSGGTFSGDVCADLSIGVTPSVGAVAELLGLELFNEELVLGTIEQQLATDVCAPWTGPVPADCDPSSECCNDGQCAPSTQNRVTVSCDKTGQSTGGGRFVYRCTNHYPDDWCRVTEDCVPAGLPTATFNILRCENNTCVSNIPRLGEDVPETEETIGCAGANCCFTDSDCGNREVCRKPSPNDGPEVVGTCENRFQQG